MLITLIYGSTATHPMSEAALLALLEQAKTNNAQHEVTGLLLYKDSNFLQVLEGEAEAVDAIFAQIENDPRHHSVVKIFRRPIDHREFSDWKMGFVDLANIQDQLPEAYSDFLNTPLPETAFDGKLSYAQSFLRGFKASIY